MSSDTWLMISAATGLCCGLWLLARVWRNAPGPVLRFAGAAIFGRLLFSALHPLTFPTLVGPFSGIALYSLVVIGMGFFIIDRRLLLLRYLFPFYGLHLLILISAVYNDSLRESIESVVKWLFFIVMALALYESVIRVGRQQTLQVLLASFHLPLLLQALSVVTGHTKATENDGSISFIGGFQHEAVFSVILLTALCLAILTQTQNAKLSRPGVALIGLIAAGIFLANYRTNILASLLPLAGFLWLYGFQKVSVYSRIRVVVLVIAGLLAVQSIDFNALLQRFSDIGQVIDNATQLIKPPAYFTDWEKDYFSSRVYFWSEYVHAYLQGDAIQLLIGAGADTWEKQFPKYAHNTFVSTLYELGLAGVLLLGFSFWRGLRLSCNGRLTPYSFLLGMCFLGFFTANLGTMPLWQIEGMILFAVLNALAWQRQLTYQIETVPLLHSPVHLPQSGVSP